MRRIFLDIKDPFGYEWDSEEKIFSRTPTDSEESHTKEDLVEAVKFVAENQEEFEDRNPYLENVFYQDLTDVDNFNGYLSHHGD